MNLRELVEKVVRYAHENQLASEVEVYAVRNRSIEVLARYGMGIDGVVVGDRVSMGIRVALGKRVAVVGGDVASERDAIALLEKAVSIARVSPEIEDWHGLPSRLGKADAQGLVDEKIKSIDMDYAISIVRELFDLPKEIDRDAHTLQLHVSYGHYERAIANSYCSSVDDEGTLLAMLVEIKVAREGKESSVFDYSALRKLDVEYLRNRVKWCCRIASLTLGARAIETGRYEVLLAPKVFASIIDALISPAIAAHNVQRNRSPLRGKIGEQVLSEQLTVVDDGVATGFVGSKRFDDEGIETRRKTVFEKGVLKTFLYDNYTALKEGKESTGNAVRRGVASMPTPGITNLVVEPGKGCLEDLINEISRGIVVFSIIGEWLSNYVSGYMNATVVNGLYVERGEIKYPIKGAVISGDFYRIMKENIVAIGADLDNCDTVYAPSILVREVNVAGK